LKKEKQRKRDSKIRILSLIYSAEGMRERERGEKKEKNRIN